MQALPSRNTTKHYVDVIVEEQRQKIKQILEKSKKFGGFAATTDTWTDKYKHVTYICISAHVNIEEETEIRSCRFILHTGEITEMVKTGEVLIRHILSVFVRYDFNEDDVKKYVVFISDRGSNIKYCLIRNGFERLTCYPHIIHNLVSYMLTEPRVKLIISQASELSAYMKNSGLNMLLETTLKRAVSTRWNSVYIMLREILNNYENIVRVLNDKQTTVKNNVLQLITWLKKQEVEQICSFLEPFKLITDNLEGDKHETLHVVWPTIVQIQWLLSVENKTSCDIIDNMKVLGVEYFKNNQRDFEPTFKHKLAMVLHPAMKRLKNIKEVDRDTIYSQIEVELKNCRAENEANQPFVIKQTSTNDINNTPQFLKQFLSFDENANDCTDSETQYELVEYLKSPLPSPLNLNLQIWWFSKKSCFPNLYKLFVRNSCIPASSASSERNFSTCGSIVTDKRNCILPKNVNNIVIARNTF